MNTQLLLAIYLTILFFSQALNSAYDYFIPEPSDQNSIPGNGQEQNKGRFTVKGSRPLDFSFMVSAILRQPQGSMTWYTLFTYMSP